MTIAVTDGTPLVASAKIVSGSCATLLVRSNSEAGPAIGYAAVQVTYNGDFASSSECQIEVTSLYGDKIEVKTQVTASSYQQSCCPYGSCCPTGSAISLHHRVEFNETVPPLSFPDPPDGGEHDAAEDSPVPIDSAVVDATIGIDGEAIDLDVDGEVVDVADEVGGGWLDSADTAALNAGTAIDATIEP